MYEFKKVKDSGKPHTEYETGSKRDNRDGKGRYDLLSPIVLKRDAVHLENGARKYDDRNWEKGQPLCAFFDSAIRHLYAYLEGNRDEDHLSAARWNIGGIVHCEEMIRRGKLPASLNNLPGYVSPVERVYIAGPYSGPTRADVWDNLDAAVKAAHSVMEKGHMVHCPHAATDPIEQINQRQSIGYEDFMALDFSIIDLWATSILYLAPSPGADRELARAKSRGLKVYRSVEEIPCLKTSSAQTETTKTNQPTSTSSGEPPEGFLSNVGRSWKTGRF